MNRTLGGLIIVLVLLVTAYWSRTHEVATNPVEGPRQTFVPKSSHVTKPMPPTVAEPVVRAQVSAPKTVVAPRPTSPSTPQKDPHLPPPKSVPFKLMDNFVVAYGDVLLGAPKTPNFPAQGFIEAPPLRFWENATIPFSIHESLPNPARVLRTIAYFNAFTPVRFVPYKGEADSVVFMPRAGECLSYLGRTGGNQPIYLDNRCGDQEIAHELMHALGMIHEHSRRDRDQYVEVNWANIEPEHVEQFDVTPAELNEPLRGRPFDFHSIMLYAPSAFALNPNVPTLATKTEDAIAPVSQGLSAEDLERVRRLYGN